MTDIYTTRNCFDSIDEEFFFFFSLLPWIFHQCHLASIYKNTSIIPHRPTPSQFSPQYVQLMYWEKDWQQVRHSNRSSHTGNKVKKLKKRLCSVVISLFSVRQSLRLLLNFKTLDQGIEVIAISLLFMMVCLITRSCCHSTDIFRCDSGINLPFPFGRRQESLQSWQPGVATWWKEVTWITTSTGSKASSVPRYVHWYMPAGVFSLFVILNVLLPVDPQLVIEVISRLFFWIFFPRLQHVLLCLLKNKAISCSCKYWGRNVMFDFMLPKTLYCAELMKKTLLEPICRKHKINPLAVNKEAPVGSQDRNMKTGLI